MFAPLNEFRERRFGLCAQSGSSLQNEDRQTDGQTQFVRGTCKLAGTLEPRDTFGALRQIRPTETNDHLTSRTVINNRDKDFTYMGSQRRLRTIKTSFTTKDSATASGDVRWRRRSPQSATAGATARSWCQAAPTLASRPDCVLLPPSFDCRFRFG